MKDSQIRFVGIKEADPPTPFMKDDGDQLKGAERRFLDHFALSEHPFGVTPDPRFLYLGSKHRQALTALTYGTDLNRGFLTLIAQPGMGKTSLLFQFLEGLRDKARTAFLFQTDGNSRDLMRHLLADLDLDYGGKDLPEMRLILNQFLLREMEAGRPFVLVIDEAQNLDEKVLESVRLLSNFETPWMKLMQIVLAGQPQLAERLAKPEMAQLRQRISFSIRIDPLTREEVSAYVNHRLWVAGYKSPNLLSVGAETLLAEYSQGIPRNINNICFSAMSLAWALKLKHIDRDMMCDVLTDMDFGVLKETTDPPPKISEQPKPSTKPSVPQNVGPVMHTEIERLASGKMDFESPEVKGAFTSKVFSQPKPSSPRNSRSAGLTVMDSPPTSLLAKFAFASVLALALWWAWDHYGTSQQLNTSWRAIVEVVKSFVVQAPGSPPASLGAVTPGSFRDLSIEPKSDLLINDKNLVAKQPGNTK